MKLLKDSKTGVWKVRIWTEHGTRTLTTKCLDRNDAVKVVNGSGLKQAELAARAGTLTAQAVSRILTGRRIDMQGAVDAWLERLSCRGRSPRTVHNYKTLLRGFVTHHHALMPASITERHVNDWLNNPKQIHKAGSLMVRLTAMRSFLEFCGDKGWCAGNAANLVEINYNMLSHEQKEPKQRLPFTDAEVSVLLTACNGDPFWYAAVLIGRYTGLRLGDIASLEWSCFIEPGKIIVWTDKHDRRVELPVEPAPLALLVERLLHRMELTATKKYVFPEQRVIAEDVKKRAMLSTQFSRLCERAGIDGKSFHCTRYSYAEDLRRRGQPLWYISQSLGHARQATTLGYLKNAEMKHGEKGK